jgi:hypothetical protein
MPSRICLRPEARNITHVGHRYAPSLQMDMEEATTSFCTRPVAEGRRSVARQRSSRPRSDGSGKGLADAHRRQMIHRVDADQREHDDVQVGTSVDELSIGIEVPRVAGLAVHL